MTDPTAPPLKKKKRVWLGKTPLPPEVTDGAVVYDAEGVPITRPGSEVYLERREAMRPPAKVRRTQSREPESFDIPTIVERYISLVGKVIYDMGAQAKKAPLKSHEINSVASIGRAVAMLQAVESASLTRVGGKPVKEHTSEQLRALLERSEAIERQEDGAEGAGSQSENEDP